MKNIKLNKWHLLNVLFIALFFSSCQWVTIEPVEIQLPDEPVKFSVDIQPIFTSKCVACHPPTKNLDLSEGNAYNSINNEQFINSTTPSESLIYTKPDPNGSHSAKYSTTESALLLKWIEEGAQNN